MGKKTVEVDGIKVKVNPKVFKSMRFALLSAKSMEEVPGGLSGDEAARAAARRGQAFVNLLDCIFGDDVERIVDELDALHGGCASAEEFGEWFNRFVEEAQAKN